MIRDEANAKDADQNQHVSAGLGELFGGGRRRLPSLHQQHPSGDAAVQEGQGAQDKQEDDKADGVDGFVEQVHLRTLQEITADLRGDGDVLFRCGDRQDGVQAHYRPKDRPGYRGEDKSSFTGLEDVVSYRMDNLQIPADETERAVRDKCGGRPKLKSPPNSPTESTFSQWQILSKATFLAFGRL